MTITTALSAALAVLGVGFYCAGTLGLLRFPDLFTRLHALTKADNVGLGLLVAALALVADSWTEVLLLVVLWAVAMAAGASSAHAVARAALRSGLEPWREEP